MMDRKTSWDGQVNKEQLTILWLLYLLSDGAVCHFYNLLSKEYAYKLRILTIVGHITVWQVSIYAKLALTKIENMLLFECSEAVQTWPAIKWSFPRYGECSLQQMSEGSFTWRHFDVKLASWYEHY